MGRIYPHLEKEYRLDFDVKALRTDTAHQAFLDLIVQHIELVGEEPTDLDYILREGKLIKYNRLLPFADLILGFHCKHYTVAELKTFNCDRSHARHQLNNAAAYVRQTKGTNSPIDKKIVYYDLKEKLLGYEVIERHWYGGN
jgi:hypothetical protein